MHTVSAYTIQYYLQVENFGPSPAAAVTVSFWIPSAISNDKNIFLNISPANELSDSNNLKCITDSLHSKRPNDNVTYIEINRPHELTFVNFTSALDCSQENVLCTEVICTIGALTEHESVVIPLQMNFSGGILMGRYQ